MSKIATERRKIILAHVCSKCGKPLAQEFTLMTDGRANAFFHEKEKALHAKDMAFEQAMKDIALCRTEPRQLGSMTQVDPGENREWAFYQIEGLDVAPCSCGHIEPWQLRKKSAWNPVDDPFQHRARITGLPAASCPVLLTSPEALEAWLKDPESV